MQKNIVENLIVKKDKEKKHTINDREQKQTIRNKQTNGNKQNPLDFEKNELKGEREEEKEGEKAKN